jgi:hypothetical protein
VSRSTARSGTIPRLALAGLLLAMAAGQLSDPAGFTEIVRSYSVGTAMAPALAALLIAGELAAGVGLVRRDGRWRRVGAATGVAVALSWSILGAQAFARGLALESCGCFGVHLGQPLRWWVLLEDLELIVWSALVGRRVWASRPSGPAPSASEARALVAAGRG